jgi:type I restriction enzyme S subunit
MAKGDLPNGWTTATLDEIAEINPRHSSNLDTRLSVTFVPMPMVSETSWRFRGTKDRPLGEVRNGYTHFAEGDVLFAKITPCMENGKAAIATGLKNRLGCGSTELHVFRPHKAIQSLYLYHFLHQESFRKDAAQHFTGTAGQLRVPVSYMREAELPIPPFNEQRRIVAKLEKLLHKVDACKERLDKISGILKRFRQSVLAAACSGRLTKDWREKHPKIGARHTVPLQDVDNGEDLPIGWRRSYVDSLIKDIQNGFSRRTSSTGKDTVVIRLADIVDQTISATKIRTIKMSAYEIEKYCLRRNDILVVRVNGSPQLVGTFVLYERRDNWTYCDHLIRLRLDHGQIAPRFLTYLSQSEAVRSHINQNMVSSAGQNTISQTTIKSIYIPLPPISEQQEIIRRVEVLFKKADEIEARYKKAKAFVDKLTQSILAKAFRGELVPQDPNDEPASVMLERIRKKGNVTLARKGRQNQGAVGRLM